MPIDLCQVQEAASADGCREKDGSKLPVYSLFVTKPESSPKMIPGQVCIAGQQATWVADSCNRSYY